MQMFNIDEEQGAEIEISMENSDGENKSICVSNASNASNAEEEE